MSTSDARLARHALLDFNSPLSDDRAAELIAGLLPIDGRVVDLGCGWAELLLRILDRVPSAVGTGVDQDGPALDRGRRNAATGGSPIGSSSSMGTRRPGPEVTPRSRSPSA